MNMHSARAPLSLATDDSLSSQRAHLWAKLGIYFAAWLDAYAAASMYEQLSRLSDHELGRRGMTRTDLHHHVYERVTARS